MNWKLFELALCECDAPTTFQNGAKTYCTRCSLQVPLTPDKRAEPPQDAPQGAEREFHAPESVIADWIRNDIQRGYDLKFIERQYGRARVRRYLNRKEAI